ncbi:hypothetical protein [Chryseobacterium sp.]|uniref:hypothetical protein n=1 Tax=Chryseobacterium sp. TaxID=1871047 RepID=UPI0025C05336|nr:hypothetical protein [Chryseobacterium sp.]MBV8327803.1 hypothetical protein [Chryseobacterium sp.]
MKKIRDAYYLRAELTDDHHPVHALTAARADDNEKRLESLEKIKKLVKEHPEIEIFGYHDREEFTLSTSKSQFV